MRGYGKIHIARGTVNKRPLTPALLIALLCLSSLGFPSLGAKPHAKKELRNEETAGQTRTPKAQAGPKKQRRHKTTRKRNRGCDETVDPAYSRLVKRLKRQPAIPKPRRRYGFRDITFFTPHNGERARFFPYRRNGTLRPAALQRVRRVFRDKRSGAEHPIHPRLVKLLYKLADHFDAKQITIISAYRAKDNGNNRNQLIASAQSHENNRGKRKTAAKSDQWQPRKKNKWASGEWGAGDNRLHANGRAVDFFLPGVPLDELFSKAKTLGHVGVGYYPAAYYVHLDVRHRASVFWTDRAAPGKRRCYRRVERRLARSHDRRWRRKEDNPTRNLRPKAAGKKPRR